MFQRIYAMSLFAVCALMLGVVFAWAILCQHISKKRWSAVNIVVLCVSTAAILYATILSRTPGDYKLILTPFASLAAARQQPELYRELLMNVFLFFPLGLTLSNALPQKWHCWGRIVLTTFVGCMLSAGIEYAQYRYALGMAEVDDVICNTLGAFIGAASLLAAHFIEKYQERVRPVRTTGTRILHIVRAAISSSYVRLRKACRRMR